MRVTVVQGAGRVGSCYCNERDELKTDVKHLNALLAEAIELAEDAMGYVPEYFQEKHKYHEQLETLRAGKTWGESSDE